jgi:ketosteroid isomerase-like protein
MMLDTRRLWLGALAALIIVATGVDAQEPRKEDHDQLRALMKRGADALTTRNIDSMAPYVTPGFTVITIDDKKLKGLAELKQYYNGLFEGSNALLKAIEVRPEADDLTQFLGDNTGVSYGVSNDRYTFRDGDVREMKSRWSAVMQKDGDVWKLVSVHFSGNLLQNPVLDAARGTVHKAALIAGVVMLVVGVVVGFLLGRRRRV